VPALCIAKPRMVGGVYDSFGLLASETDPRGNTTGYTYEKNGNEARLVLTAPRFAAPLSTV